MSIFANNIISAWLSWHFFSAPKSILKAWRNFLVFNLNYFSISLLLRTFFSPWRRYQWSYGKGFDFQRYLYVFFSNLISRILGAFVRTFLIVIGLIFEVFIILGGIFIFLIWLILPILLILGLWFGLKIIF